jgi:NAD(P)-dependent dehydrogenase (short-subunit alcohol dehydrogenase family)
MNATILTGKAVIVTGAARGLGWGIARAIGQAGAGVCISDINDEELARSEKDLRTDGSDVMSLHLDVSDLNAFQGVVKQVLDRWGRLDAVVQNAVYMPLVRFENTSEENWWRQLHISLRGLFNATRAGWDVMKAQGGGHIIGIASGSSVRGYINEVAYCTGKHGQEGLVKALSLEASDYQIALNTIGPGKPIKPTDVTWEEYDQLPAQTKAEWADPVELGKAFVWLISQPPGRFHGFRFDAGPIVDTIAREGYEFEFAPEKVTLYVDDFKARQEWYARFPG